MFLILILSVGLVACGGESSNGNNEKVPKESASTQNKDNKDDSSKEATKEDDTVQESDIGKMTIVYKNKDLNENAESGPMSLTINAIQLGELEVAEDYKEIFDDKDKLTVVTIQMKAENSSDDTIGFYPDQATITTDAGDQVDADMLLSEQVGGDFIGKVKKEGQVFFLVDTPASEIGQVNLIIDGAHNEDFEEVGKQIKLSFETK